MSFHLSEDGKTLTIDNFRFLMLDICPIENAFSDVIQSYVNFLQHTARLVVETCKGTVKRDVRRDIRKFSAVKRELYEFLHKHKKFYQLKKIDVMMNGEVIYTLNMNYSDSFEQFLKLGYFIKYIKTINHPDPIMRFDYKIDNVRVEICENVESSLGKPALKDEDVTQFLKSHYLVDKYDLETKCSTYKELEDDVNSRHYNYAYEKVTDEHVSNFNKSSEVQKLINDFEVEKACGVRLEDYGKE